MTTRQKLARLTRLVEGEERFLHDHKAELLRFLKDPDPTVREMALRGLWDYPDDDVAERLLCTAEEETDEKVKVRAVITMGRIIYEGAITEEEHEAGVAWLEAVDELTHEGPSREAYARVRDYLFGIYRTAQASELRRRALEALGFLDAPEVRQMIREAYNSPDPLMKTSAVFAMGRNADPEWTPTILAELDSEDPQVRLEAIRAAGEAVIEEAAPRLMEIAAGPDRELRAEALWALGETGGEGVREFLQRYAESTEESTDIREVAAAALEELDLFEGTDLLEDLNGTFLPKEER
jgi:hypothetical protein